ncbi:MAG: sigma-70 family RNA polymerase sigma factor [Clostridiales Family XIII bacterium]|jgi:RNA polymerase sporulation-specific sigma factor|nr:sigma-70 family RNA polymerase sigma factor [Clostridiales Family XIII bacterium]
MNTEYEKLSHEKLVKLARSGNEAALELIFREYRETIRGKASLYFLAGGDTGDLVQEGMIGLFRAIMDYDESKEASFRTYAELLIARQMIAAVRSAARQKHIPLNTSLSLDASAGPISGGAEGEAGVGGEGGASLGDMLPDAAGSPEEALLAKDGIERLEAECVHLFSKFELCVWNEYKNGMAYTEIAKILGKTPKAIDNALQRMKKKVARALLEQ